MNYRKLLGENIKKYRKIRRISQEQLAERSKLHRTYIGATERGERNISIDNIEKICKALDVNLKDLINDRR
ncbi:DNA-binding transcriptional regulator, XRE-family HTH domain [Virgibacillus subterraneus]|uniref:DNA-binding transcriptional regulator, XRE-family HTH domain n=1 Tax=Virgibacillus subterraneus TaxID=621109 RepID=A0A1H9GAJ5_9BACI|nr:helix-turn-helix transcriptional regulator [Virgibacillus subterraneus]SEQ47090.1 DNA-binding transcriptional regulator, XRE-family HTH domain [Virgibacillus subterraneus]